MVYKIARQVGEYYIPLSDKIERQLDSEWRSENSAVRSPHIAGGKYKFPDGTGKGWHGDTPGHKEAANQNKTASVKHTGCMRHTCNKSPSDPTFSKEWSGVSGAPHARGKHCPDCGEQLHSEAGSFYCPRCDNYKKPAEGY